MNAEPLSAPEACLAALAAIGADPLEPGSEAEAHLRTCPACTEARIHFLAQEEVPEVLAPAGYFDHLPGRLLGKLPARPVLRLRMGTLAWAAAAALLMAVGAGAFLAGRANRTPYIEARQPDALEVLPSDTPFHSREEDASQVQALTPEEMQTLLRRLDPPAPASPR